MPLSPRVPDIAALDLLLSVARLGSLGRAAREHGITQPAVGSQIRRLEGLLGLSLIERSALGSPLTADGAVVVDWARDVITAAAEFDIGVNALRSQHDAKLPIAASMTVAEYLMPSWLVELQARRPNTTVALRVVNSSEVTRLVHTGDADIGFIESPEVSDGLQHQTVGHDRLQLVVAPEHKWSRRRRPVSAAELATTPLVHREPGSGTRDTLEAVLAPHGPVCAPLVELSSTTAIKTTVQAGVGPAVLSSLAVTDELAHGQLVMVSTEEIELSRTLRAVWPTGRHVTPVMRDILAVTRR